MSKIAFAVRLSPEAVAKIKELASSRNLSQAQVVEELIKEQDQTSDKLDQIIKILKGR